MGRKKQTQPPLEPEFIRQAFAIGDNSGADHPAQHRRGRDIRPARQVPVSGLLSRPNLPRRRRQARLVPCRRLLTRVASSRLAMATSMICAHGNLIEVRRGPHPFTQSAGGKASSLDHRTNVTTRLLQTLAEHPGQTLPTISRSVGVSESCTVACQRFRDWQTGGLACGPKCDASEVGLESSGPRACHERQVDPRRQGPRHLDDHRPVASAVDDARPDDFRLPPDHPQEGRRAHPAQSDQSRQSIGSRITDAGLAALPDIPPRWLDPQRISAAAAPDVHGPSRRTTLDDRTSIQALARSHAAQSPHRATARGEMGLCQPQRLRKRVDATLPAASISAMLNSRTTRSFDDVQHGVGAGEG